MFLPHECTISKKTTSVVNGNQVKSETVVYSDIDCMFYESTTPSLQNAEIGRQADEGKKKLIMQGSNINIDKGYVVVVTDP